MRLLDVNVLMALLWENHEQRELAYRWFRSVSAFATCPLTQLGFVRVSSLPQLGYSVSVDHAFRALRRLLAGSRHHFVPDDVSGADRVLLTEDIVAPNQVTDYYLAALARQHGLTLATFDAALSRAFPAEPDLVELVQ